MKTINANSDAMDNRDSIVEMIDNPFSNFRL